jgi:uncharacterized protein YjiS (DUF1127 family)
MPRDSGAKNKRGAHTSSLSFRIQVLRQKIHQLEWSPAVDHLVDQIALTAWQLLDHAPRRGPDGFVCPMDTCRKEQHQRGVSQIHGKPRENSHRSVPTLVFSVLAPTKRCLAVSIFRLPCKGRQAKRMGKSCCVLSRLSDGRMTDVGLARNYEAFSGVSTIESPQKSAAHLAQFKVYTSAINTLRIYPNQTRS